MVHHDAQFVEGIHRRDHGPPECLENDDRKTDGDEQGACKTVPRSHCKGREDTTGEQRIEEVPGPNSKYCDDKDPMQMFIDSLPLVKKKVKSDQRTDSGLKGKFVIM
jgi:hypothetical protein